MPPSTRSSGPPSPLSRALSRANRGNIGGAFQALSEAFELAKRNGNQIALSRIPNGIGWLWREMGDITRAMEFNFSNSASLPHTFFGLQNADSGQDCKNAFRAECARNQGTDYPPLTA